MNNNRVLLINIVVIVFFGGGMNIWSTSMLNATGLPMSYLSKTKIVDSAYGNYPIEKWVQDRPPQTRKPRPIAGQEERKRTAKFKPPRFRTNPDSGRIERRKAIAREEIIRFREPGFEEDLAYAHFKMGVPFFLEGETDSALYYYQNARQIFEALENYDGITLSVMSMGAALVESDRYTEAIQLMILILPIQEKLQNYRQLAIVYSNIGDLYLGHKEIGLAISNYEMSLEMLKLSNWFPPKILVHANLGRAYLAVGEIEKALSILEIGIEEAKKNGNQSMLIDLFLVKGKLLSDIGELEAAQDLLTHAMELAILKGYKRNQVEGYHLLGRNELAKGNLENARSNGLKALELTKELEKSKDGSKISILELIGEAEEQLGYFESALEHMLLAAEISDRLYKEERVARVSEIHIIYEAEKKEQTIKLLEIENKSAQLKILLAITIGLSFIIILSLIYWQTSKRKEKERRFKLKSVRKELEGYGALIAEKDSVLNDLSSKLSSMTTNFNSIEAKKETTSLIDSLNQNMKLTEKGDKLLQRIEQVNTGFFMG